MIRKPLGVTIAFVGAFALFLKSEEQHCHCRGHIWEELVSILARESERGERKRTTERKRERDRGRETSRKRERDRTTQGKRQT